MAPVRLEFHQFGVDLCNISSWKLSSDQSLDIWTLSGFLHLEPALSRSGVFLLPESSSPSPLQFASRYWIHENGEDILAISLA